MHQAGSTTQRDGFTLIELLIVIVILGVLATVVVFAVGGIVDRGDASSSAADERTLVGAQEAYRALHGTYTDEAELVSAGFLRDDSSLHDITLAADRTSYSVVAATSGGGGGGGGPIPTTAPPPTTASPTGPVPTTWSGYSGQALGSGSKTLVIIGSGSGAATTLFNNLQADPLVDTQVVWLNSGDVTETADVDAILAGGADYVVAAQAVSIEDSVSGGDTFVGSYMASFLDWPGQFWWIHSQGIPTTSQLQSHL